MEIAAVLSSEKQSQTNPILFSPQIYLGVENKVEKTNPIWGFLVISGLVCAGGFFIDLRGQIVRLKAKRR